MKLKSAVACNIKKVYVELGIVTDQLTKISNITILKIFGMLNEKMQYGRIVYVKKLYDGLEISLCAYFYSPLLKTREVN